jgi:hypothetical protein
VRRSRAVIRIEHQIQVWQRTGRRPKVAVRTAQRLPVISREVLDDPPARSQDPSYEAAEQQLPGRSPQTAAGAAVLAIAIGIIRRLDLVFGGQFRYSVAPGTRLRHPAEADRRIAGLLALIDDGRIPADQVFDDGLSALRDPR